jgi:hypothetical protein
MSVNDGRKQHRCPVHGDGTWQGKLPCPTKAVVTDLRDDTDGRGGYPDMGYFRQESYYRRTQTVVDCDAHEERFRPGDGPLDILRRAWQR